MRTVRATLARDLVYGAVLAFVCTGLAFVVALAGFGRLYYVSIFLPFFMLACLLVAWFLYLKDDGFIGSAQVSGSSDGKPAGGSAGARRALVWAADRKSVV